VQVIAAAVAFPLVVEIVLAVGYPVVEAERERDTPVLLLERHQAPVSLGVVDTLAGRVDTTGMVAGNTEVAADWPRSQNGRTLS
jgi:hypothetical protein